MSEEPVVSARRIRVRLVVAVALVLVLVGALITRSRPSTGVARAREIAASDSRWDSTREASDALGEITEVLFDLADDCSTDDPRCSAIYEAIGFTQVSAVFVLRCTQPGVVTLRNQLGPYLVELGETLDGRGPPPAGLRIPSC